MADISRLIKDPEALARWAARTVAERLAAMDPLLAPTVVRSGSEDRNEAQITLAVELDSCRISVSGWEGYEEYDVAVTRFTGQEVGRAEFEGKRSPGGRLFTCLDKIERRQMATWAAEMAAEIEGLGR